MNAVEWQKIEGLGIAIAALALALLVQPGWAWWFWPIVALWPDISMLGYLAGRRVGATVYNAFHLYSGGLILAVLGVVTGATFLIALGAMWLAHIGIDRALGFGLKLPSGFKDTNLGRIGDRSS